MNTNKRSVGQILTDSRKAKKGLPALNYSDMWDLMAIAVAAEKNGRQRYRVKQSTCYQYADH